MGHWKATAINALIKLDKDRQAVDGLGVQILQKRADMIALTEMGYGQPDDPEGAPSPRIRKLMDEKRTLEAKKEALAAHVAQVDKALAAMAEQDREILATFYFTGLSRTAAQVKLESKQNITRTEVYRRRDKALLDFAYRMGWI